MSEVLGDTNHMGLSYLCDSRGEKAAQRELGALTQATVFTMLTKKGEKLAGQPTTVAASLVVFLFYWVEGIAMDV